MSELRTRLERLGDRIQPAPDAFERLERTRRRRQRSRRIAAGVVAFLVAVAGSLTAFTAFRDGEPSAGGTVEDGFFALWPEKTYEQALLEQSAIDQGALSRRAWRLDPLVTAEEFARSALGWGWETPGEVEIHAEVAGEGDAAGPGPITVDVSLLRHGPGTAALFASLRMARLVRADGIWSVVQVGGDAFNLRVAPGEQVALDGFVAVPTTLREGTEVAVGVAGTGSCSGFHEQTGEVIDGLIVVPVQGVGEGCTGYLYALTPPTPTGQVELGRIMFVWGEPKPALGYTIESIAAVPVRFIAPSEEEPPSAEPPAADIIHVACDQTTIEIDVDAVAASPAGVHVVVDAASQPMQLAFAPGSRGPWNAMPVELGMTQLALQLPPGNATFRCSASQGVFSEDVQVEVVDPSGLFVPYELACPGEPALAGTVPAAAWQGSEPVPDPIEFARSRIDGVLPTDVVERAGYPEALDPVIRLVRDGAVVGSFGIHRESGEWALNGTWCSGLGISVPSGPDPYPRGAFEWCPGGPFPEPGVDWSDRAAEAAIRFVEASAAGDTSTIDALLDPSVPPDAELRLGLNEVRPTVLGTDAHGGPLVEFGCGDDVDAYTVAVTLDDGTDSASLDIELFLILRDDGWKVWGKY